MTLFICIILYNMVNSSIPESFQRLEKTFSGQFSYIRRVFFPVSNALMRLLPSFRQMINDK